MHAIFNPLLEIPNSSIPAAQCRRKKNSTLFICSGHHGYDDIQVQAASQVMAYKGPVNTIRLYLPVADAGNRSIFKTL